MKHLDKFFAFCLAITGIVGTVFAEGPDMFVRYVEATGLQYIDTGVAALPDTKAECKVEWLELGDTSFLACRKNDTGSDAEKNTRYYGCHSYNGKMFPAYGIGSVIPYTHKNHDRSDGSTITVDNLLFEANRIYTYTAEFSRKYENNQITNKVWVNGSNLYSKGGEYFDFDSDDPGCSLYVFACNVNGKAKYLSKSRCYGIRIWQGGVLIRDFRPCVKDNRAGLYDACENKIYYSGSGTDLVYDPRTDLSIPDVFVDYVESTGNSYIDTGIIGRSGSSVEMEMMFMNSHKDEAFLNARLGNDTRFYLLNNYYSGDWLYGYGGWIQFGNAGGDFEAGRKYFVRSSLATGRQVVEIRENGPDGEVKRVVDANDNKEIDTGLNMYLFACNQFIDGISKINSPTQARVYWLKMYQDGELVRDFRPCLRYGVAGLYDTVTAKIFYPNAVDKTKSAELAYSDKRYGDMEAVGDDEKGRLKFVEYIESDGEAYLDTQVAAEMPMRATGTFCYMQARKLNEEESVFAGVYSRSYLANSRYSFIYQQNQYYKFTYNGTGVSTYNGADLNEGRVRTGVTCDFDISFADGVQKFQMKPALENAFTVEKNLTGSEEAGDNLYLFAVYDPATKTAVNHAKARCYGLKLYKGEGENSVLVRDFKPCVKDGWVALYDEVSKRVFYTTPRLSEKGRVGAVSEESCSNSAFETFLEYVETDGTQYVDTGAVGKSGTTVVFRETKISANNSGETCFLGSRDRSQNTSGGGARFFPWYYANGNELAIGYYNNYERLFDGEELYKKYQGMTSHVRVSLSPGKQTVNLKDEATGNWKVLLNKSIDGDVDTGKNLYLFAENDNGTAARNCQSRFYWLKLHQDGNLSLSLHPARLKNGLVVLWDVKRNMAYPPRGQDGRIREFSAAGPEIPYTDVVKRGVKIIVR